MSIDNQLNSKIEDVRDQEVVNTLSGMKKEDYDVGFEALKNGELAVISLAGGLGTRWTKGAGVVTSLNPFAKISGKHRNFIEAHLAKSRKISKMLSSAQIMCV